MMTELSNFTYPEMREYHSYGIRFWNGSCWLYYNLSYTPYSKSDWCVNIDKCWTSTDLVGVMLKIQDLARVVNYTIELVEFEEPKTIWRFNTKNRRITLEDGTTKRTKRVKLK